MPGKVQVARRERLHRLCKSIIADPRIVDAGTVAAFKKATMQFVHCQYDDPERAFKNLYQSETETGQLVREAAEIVIKRLDNMEVSPATGALYSRTRSFLDVIDDDDDRVDDDNDDGDGDDDDIEKLADHHVSRLADLLVESGRFTDRGHALRHLTSHPDGVALVRTHKAKDHPPMDTLLQIMKDGSVRPSEWPARSSRSAEAEREGDSTMMPRIGDSSIHQVPAIVERMIISAISRSSPLPRPPRPFTTPSRSFMSRF
jgi:hypothetical protein